MNIYVVSILQDNYVWIIEQDKKVIIVDPGSSQEVIDFIKENNFLPEAILLTHNHSDHIDGVRNIVKSWPKISIFGPQETINFNTNTINNESVFYLQDTKIKVLFTPGHTNGHISYLLDDQHLFCGDALFSGGCGRVFTNDYNAQFNTLCKFRNLPKNIKIYCGHEYTITNLKFNLSMKPQSKEIKKALEDSQKLVSNNLPTLPSTIEKEININLFLNTSNVTEFKKLRDLRDKF